MRAALLVIGVILILGGVRGLQNPKDYEPMVSGRHQTLAEPAWDEPTARFAGWTAIFLGATLAGSSLCVGRSTNRGEQG